MYNLYVFGTSIGAGTFKLSMGLLDRHLLIDSTSWLSAEVSLSNTANPCQLQEFAISLMIDLWPGEEGVPWIIFSEYRDFSLSKCTWANIVPSIHVTELLHSVWCIGMIFSLQANTQTHLDVGTYSNMQGEVRLHANNSIFYLESISEAPGSWTQFSGTVILRTRLKWAFIIHQWNTVNRSAPRSGYTED